MATVVITFFLLALFYVCKMDADCIPRRRDRALSRREKRWSMNSQRLEEIVAELMKPISDVRRSFDTDLSALLEEYLTEAGLHALDAHEGEPGALHVAPNFAELAMLLQQSASLYGRKVDFLYQHVISVSESLHNSTQELSAPAAGEEPQTPSSSKRRRRTLGAEGADGAFAEIEVEACAGAARDVVAARPPPTLPRMYIELEPRVLTEADAPLHDYHGEPIGLLTDFHVTWRLQEGLLVEELDGAAGACDDPLRPLSLVELQRALEASAPPLPPVHPLSASTPLPRESTSPPHRSPLPSPSPPPSAPPKGRCERKRKNELSIDDILGGRIKLAVGKELRRKLHKVEEFSIPDEWIAKVVEDRKDRILCLRKRLRAHQPRPPNLQFHGFELACPTDIGGFCGWSESEALVAAAAAAAAAACRGAATRHEVDSDDDGFFEQSSLGDSDGSRVEDSALNHTHMSGASEAGAEWASWQAQVVRRAAEGEARGGVDVRRLGGRVLGACERGAPATTPFVHLLAAEAAHQVDVSRLLLATLFLANAGSVEIVRGAPLTVDTFSLRLISTDERLYCAAAAAAAAADLAVSEPAARAPS